MTERYWGTPLELIREAREFLIRRFKANMYTHGRNIEEVWFDASLMVARPDGKHTILVRVVDRLDVTDLRGIARALRHRAHLEGEWYHAVIVLNQSPTAVNVQSADLGEIALLDHHFRFLREPGWVREISPEAYDGPRGSQRHSTDALRNP